MKIITDQNFLKIPCEKISLEEVSNIILQLEKFLKDSEVEGIGLAANQIGIKKQVAIIRMDKISINLVNADITAAIALLQKCLYQWSAYSVRWDKSQQ